jgi:uncharacterized membrane protein YiaA
MQPNYQPTNAFVLTSWAVLITGIVGFLIGLWNAGMGIEEKGYYFITLAFGLFSAVSVQKSVRDRIENIPVSDIYYGICWLAAILSVALLGVGLFNATNLIPSEKGFYAMTFVLSMFAAIAVQKNVRDQMQANQHIVEKPVAPTPLYDNEDF